MSTDGGESTPVFGIDLGTTYSCIAYVDEHGRPTVVPNRDSEMTTPSVVMFDSADRHIVGRQAKRSALARPDQTCSLVKRKMGDPNWRYDAHGAKWSAPVISSYVLGAVAADAKRNTSFDVSDVVITVPAYFGESEREDTKLAGRLAGLEVLDIINEPMAAAVFYGLEMDADAAQTILVYDLGGGTFDAVILRLTSSKITTLVSAGLHELGGFDWDKKLAELVVRRFLEENSGAEDPMDDPNAYQALMLEVEQCKQSLTERESVNFPYFYDGHSMDAEVTVADFEGVTEFLLERTIDMAREQIEKARSLPDGAIDQIDRILLVGGASKMPAVARRLKDEFGVEPELKDPDFAVAKGAAMWGLKHRLTVETEELQQQQLGEGGGSESAEALGRTEAIEKVAEKHGLPTRFVTTLVVRTSTNVCPRGFGIGALDDSREFKVFFLAHQNDPLPLECESEDFHTTFDDQTEVEISVYEQAGPLESTNPDDNKLLIRGAITGIPKGHPAYTKLTVTLKMQSDGTLELTARHPGAHEPLELRFTGGTRDPALIEAAHKQALSSVRRD